VVISLVTGFTPPTENGLPTCAQIDDGHAAGDTEALKNLERRAKPD
jgi:hypothetical protein